MAINFHSFIQTDEWQHLVAHLTKTKLDLANEIIDACSSGNANQAMFIGGKMQMIDELLAIPEYLYSTTRKENGHAADEKGK